MWKKKRSDRGIMKMLKEGKRWSWRKKGRKDEGLWIERKGYERQKRKSRGIDRLEREGVGGQGWRGKDFLISVDTC